MQQRNKLKAENMNKLFLDVQQDKKKKKLQQQNIAASCIKRKSLNVKE